MKTQFSRIIGTGGIGVGLLFESTSNNTLGRNESRLVHLSDAKDYCKQQIVLHYTASIVGHRIPVYPIGYVGMDSYGSPLIKEMENAGMITEHVRLHPSLPTTISFCLQYPDKDGCNITASNGASGAVSPEIIVSALDEIGVDQQTLLVAIPEVKHDARMEMLRYGRAHDCFNALSIPEAEATLFREANVFAYCDLLAVNELEAVALNPGADNRQALVKELHRKMQAFNPHAYLVVTCGKDGAYAAHSGGIEFIPPLPTNPVNTTGAGDAFLGGLLAGLSHGLPLAKGREDKTFGQTDLTSASELGALCAGMSVESIDTIAQQVNRVGLLKRIRDNGWQVDQAFNELLME